VGRIPTGEYSHECPQTEAKARFANFTATKQVAVWLFDFEVKGTKNIYASALFRFWDGFLSQKYATVADWIADVKAQRRVKDDPVARTSWATDVRTFMKTRRGLGRRPMATASRELLSSSVKSFLRKWVDEELDYDFKIKYTVDEVREKRKQKAISVEEMRQLYEGAKNNRDKALLLGAVNGVAPAEIIQFVDTWKEWFPKNSAELVPPFKVNLVIGSRLPLSRRRVLASFVYPLGGERDHWGFSSIEGITDASAARSVKR